MKRLKGIYCIFFGHKWEYWGFVGPGYMEQFMRCGRCGKKRTK